MAITANSPLQVTIHPLGSESYGPPAPSQQKPFWNEEGPSFQDVLDVINPLQHIPIVSNIYQSLTGDMQSTGAKLAGSAVFGGPIGFIASLFDSIIESATGADMAGNIMAAIEGEPVPALHNGTSPTAPNGEPSFLSPNQRFAYNAYVRASMLA